jgi:hypothetical protein
MRDGVVCGGSVEKGVVSSTGNGLNSLFSTKGDGYPHPTHRVFDRAVDRSAAD